MKITEAEYEQYCVLHEKIEEAVVRRALEKCKAKRSGFSAEIAGTSNVGNSDDHTDVSWDVSIYQWVAGGKDTYESTLKVELEEIIE